MRHHVHHTLTLNTPGANPLLLEAVKQHLRVESDDDDEYVTALMEAAQSVLDGRDGILGRALLTQQWTMQRERFSWYPYPYAGAPYDYAMMHRDWAWDPWQWRKLFAIHMPLPPLVSVDSFTYTDPNYVTQSLVQDTDYRIVAGGGAPAMLLPMQSAMIAATWPATAIEPDAVQIQFTCGYPNAEALAAERGGIIRAMKLLIGLWYKEREAALVGARAAQVSLPFGVEAVLASHYAQYL